MNRSLLRWVAPTAAAVVFVGGGAAVSALGSAASADLPARSPKALLVDLAHPTVHGFSGTIQQSADLGLPALPASLAGQGGTAAFSSLISGDHTLRVWYAAPGRTRIAVLGDGTESDLIGNRDSLWSWSSADHTATHWQLPVPTDTAAVPAPDGLASMNPQRLAAAALAAIRPTTRVSSNGSARIAGRRAYLLTISPRTRNTLVDSVQIAIDRSTHVPLRVQVFAVGHRRPALSVGYTRFSPRAPEAKRFAFTPPADAKVVEKQLSTPTGPHSATSAPDAGRPDLVGSGWSSVVVLPASVGQEMLSAKSGPTTLLRRLPHVSGDWGSGRLLRGTLVSVLLSDDGRIALGAVPPRSLYAALRPTAVQR